MLLQIYPHLNTSPYNLLHEKSAIDPHELEEFCVVDSAIGDWKYSWEYQRHLLL